MRTPPSSAATLIRIQQHGKDAVAFVSANRKRLWLTCVMCASRCRQGSGRGVRGPSTLAFEKLKECLYLQMRFLLPILSGLLMFQIERLGSNLSFECPRIQGIACITLFSRLHLVCLPHYGHFRALLLVKRDIQATNSCSIVASHQEGNRHCSQAYGFDSRRSLMPLLRLSCLQEQESARRPKESAQLSVSKVHCRG